MQRIVPESPDSLKEEISPLLSEKDREKHCVSVSKKIQKRKHIIPPAYSLLPKSQVPDEPLQTGSRIPFLKLTHAKAGSNLLIEPQVTEEKSAKIKEFEEIEGHKGKRVFKSMFYQELRGSERNPIVYSRYSDKCYDPTDKLPEDLMSSCIVNIK